MEFQTGESLWVDEFDESRKLEGQKHIDDADARPIWVRYAPWVSVCILSGLLCFLLYKTLLATHMSSQASGSVPAVSSAQVASTDVVVDVKGDVLHPGVYKLADGSRVTDAVRMAGGLLHSEDTANVNMAAQLDDGSEIIVPGPAASTGDGSIQATTDMSVSRRNSSSRHSVQPASRTTNVVNGSRSRPAHAGAIDLNTANASTLETIHGIGPKRAMLIVSYRTQHGPFRTIDDLRQIRGIGPKLFSQISQFLMIAK